MTNRRNFLLGAAGAGLSIPLLESLAPRRARSQDVVAPKRLLIVLSENGRLVGAPSSVDWWSPGTRSRVLTPGEAPSRMLAALAPIANEIVTVDGVDNVVRNAAGDGEGHICPQRTLLTCTPPSGMNGGGPSLDYVAGLRLRSGEGMRPSVIVPMSATPVGVFFTEPRCWGEGGTDPATVSGNPEMAIEELFGPAPPPDDGSMPTRPTLRERMALRRTSLLDGVRESLGALRGRVSTRDRERLDRHAEFIRRAEARFAGAGPGMAAAACMRPDPTGVPHVVPSTWDEFTTYGELPEWRRDRADPITSPYQIENVVQALACDVVRSMVVTLNGDPTWASEFSGTSPFDGDGSVHGAVHNLPRITEDDNVTPSPSREASAADLVRGYQAFGRQFTTLIQRLAAIEDVDGRRLLDNTLVLWTSELGYGSEHRTCNLPIVLAGLGDAFSGGLGRHVVEPRRTTGDLYAQMLRMLGGTDTTFGVTGTVGSVADASGNDDIQVDYGFPDHVSRSTPLHTGTLDL